MAQLSNSIITLCDIKKATTIGGRATMFGRPVRFDEVTELFSVRDVIMVIEGTSPENAQKKLERLVKNKRIVVSEGATKEYSYFKDANHYR